MFYGSVEGKYLLPMPSPITNSLHLCKYVEIQSVESIFYLDMNFFYLSVDSTLDLLMRGKSLVSRLNIGVWRS